MAMQPWNDVVFCRVFSDTPEWFYENHIDGEVSGFSSREEAEDHIRSQMEERAEIERWARIIDDRLWADFDIDGRARDGFMVDHIFESLKKAKRVRATLS